MDAETLVNLKQISSRCKALTIHDVRGQDHNKLSSKIIGDGRLLFDHELERDRDILIAIKGYEYEINPLVSDLMFLIHTRTLGNLIDLFIED